MDDNTISRYTRKQAIEDGELIDVSEYGKPFRYRLPVAMSASFYAALEEVVPRKDEEYDPLKHKYEHIEGAIYGVLANALYTAIVSAIKQGPHRDTISLLDRDVIVDISHGDQGEPVMTIMFSDDD